MHLPSLLFLAAAAASTQSPATSSKAFNATVMDNLNNDFDLRHLSLFLRSYCGQPLASLLQNRTMNVTLLAPTDQAIESSLNWTSVRGGADLNCTNQPGGNLTTLSQGCQGIPLNVSQLPVAQIAPCLPLILSYHVLPERLNLTGSGESGGGGASANATGMASAGGGAGVEMSTMNVTVVNTMLNDTRLTNLTQQVVILNQTSTGEWWANHGAWPPAKLQLNRTIEGVNGVAYLVDRILLPPLNLTQSLQLLNLTSANATTTTNMFNDTELGQVGNLTAFLPIDAFSSQQQFNLTNYLVNGTVLYNNATAPANLTLSSMGGTQLNITLGQNYTMRVGNASVVHSNILLSNGVLHLLEGGQQQQGRSGGLLGRLVRRC